MPDDISGSINTTGRVTVGNSLTGEIETTTDSDAYAVELVAGRTYRIDLEGAATGKGTLADPFLRWLRDSSGNGLHGTRDNDGGEGLNPRQVFTPQWSGTYYITASGQGDSVGTYTLRVTDTSLQQAPAFGQESYAFTLAENADGALFGIAVGSVSATDPEGAPVTYSIEAGDRDGLFMVDAATGLVVYLGAGEDYESGTTSYELTVRASDGQLTADTTVTVNVTDVAEAPAFAYASYAFGLAENADGSAARVSLGMVSATDPEGASVGYSIVGGNESGSFEIDAASGELFYVGTGEDYEAGAAQFDLTIRASDGALSADAAVSVAVTDAPEQTIAAPADPEILQTVSELAGEDFSRNISTAGRIVVDDTATGNIGTRGDRDWFAVELVADREYRIDLRGSPTGDGTLSDPYLRGIYDAEGALISGTTNDDGGADYNSRVTFTPTETGAYYIVAGAYYTRQGTYELEVRDVSPHAATQEGENGLPAFGQTSYAFDLAENAGGDTIPLSLGRVTATDPENSPITYSIESGDPGGLFAIDEATGALSYQGAGEDYESGTRSYELTVRASDGGLHADVTVSVNVGDVAEAPAFAETSYTFDLAENAAGDTLPLALGLVQATDPEDGTITYSIESGNAGGLFAIDEATGALSYRGAGEDYESGTTSYDLTVRASDGGLHSDVTVNVNVTDVEEYVILEQGTNEAPQFAYASYAFSLAENADGGAGGVSLGSVTATDPENSPITYSIVGGDPGGLFAIDAATGALSYRGAGEDYESGTTSYDLTVRASDGALHNDVTVTINVTDVAEAPAFGQDSYEFDLAENAGGDTIPLSLGLVQATDPENSTITYSIESGDPGGLFAIDEATGALSYRGAGEDYESGTTSYELTVRASDGTGHSDVTVTVNVADVADEEEYVALEQGITTDVSEPDDSDFPATTSTTGAVTVGGEVSGKIGAADDRDWFAVTLEADKTYRIDLKGSPTGNGTLTDPYLRGVHDANGVRIAGTTDDDGGSGLNSRVTFPAVEAGTYYVAASAYRDGEGTYTLSVTDITNGVPDDFAAGTDTSGVVAVGGSSTGEIEYEDDRDWFAVELEAGGIYRIDLEGSSTDAGSLSDPYLRGVYDADGDLIAGTTNNNGGAGRNSRVYFTAAEAATYYVAAGADRDGEGTYTLSVTDLPDGIPDDFAAGTGTSGVVAVGGSSTGEIEYADDRDWFAVTLEADKTYRIDLRGSWTGNGTLSDPYLYGIHDANGDLIADTTDDDGGANRNARVYFDCDTAGTYYLAADGYGTSQGTYTLSVADVTDGEPDDFSAGTDTTGAVDVGGSVSGHLELWNDRDWFAVELEGGRFYSICLDGSWTGDNTLYDPVLRAIYDTDGNRVASAGGHWGGNRKATFAPLDDGTYYVEAGGGGGDEGTYTLSVTDVSHRISDDFEAGTGTTGRVAVGGSATGEIDYIGDRDWFAVELSAGNTYRFDQEHPPNVLYAPLLRGIHDADGNFIAGTRDSSDSYGDSRVFFTPEDTGTYYVAAGASANATGSYTLSVINYSSVSDDYAAGTGTTGAVAVGGSATGRINYADDRDWFAVELEAGKSYQIDMRGSTTGHGTLYGPDLIGIHDAAGDLIFGTWARDGGVGVYPNSRVTFTATNDGTYYVEAAGNDNRTGTYTLSVTHLTDDYAAGTDTIGTVDVGGSVMGKIEIPNDRDWFAVELQADTAYRIDLEGQSTRAGTLNNPKLYGVRDADGNRISGTTNDDGGAGSNSQVTFTAEETGTYYVEAGAPLVWLGGGWQGTYALSVREYRDDFTAGTGTSGTVAVGGTARGEIGAAGDRDWFAVMLEAGTSYRIDLKGSPTGSGSLSDPYLHGIHDADGVLIADTTNDDGGAGRNSRVTFTAEDAGTYYVAAGAYENEEGTYTLSVEEVL